jgi:DNA-binding transcriptional ArsR family regulator
MDAMTHSSRPVADSPDEFARMSAQARSAADFLKALAHENRLLILCLLAQGERSVGDLERILGLRQPAVSQQLARLRNDSLVATRREGKIVYYSLASDQARSIIGAVHQAFCGQNSEA